MANVLHRSEDERKDGLRGLLDSLESEIDFMEQKSPEPRKSTIEAILNFSRSVGTTGANSRVKETFFVN
jgi:hypothetical protein